MKHPAARPVLRRSLRIAFVGLLGALLGALLGGCAAGDLRVPRRWEPALPSFAAPVFDFETDPADPETIYAACGWQTRPGRPFGGVLRTTDQGRSWLEHRRGLPVHRDVLTLAVAPAGFLAEGEVLLAGTRQAGVYALVEGAAWRRLGEAGVGNGARLTINALVALPGGPPALAAGTEGHGVLVSTDGGATWEARNDGLLNLTVKAVAVDGDLLIAGTWSGVYRSGDRGRSWQPIDSIQNLEADSLYAKTAVAALALDTEGALWLGLQNDGLAVRRRLGDAFSPHGGAVLDGAGILTIRADGRRIVVGTHDRGAVLGHLDGRFVAVDKGLGSRTVSAVWTDPRDPDAILVGTRDGLYRGVPPISPVVPILAGLGLAGLGAVLAVRIRWRRLGRRLGRLPRNLGQAFARRLRRRAVASEARQLFHGLQALPLEDAPAAVDRRIATLDAADVETLTELLARRWEAASRPPVMATYLRLTGRIFRCLHATAGYVDTAKRRGVADALDARSSVLEALEVASEPGNGRSPSRLGLRSVAVQDHLFATLLRSESLSHVAALRDELGDLRQAIRIASPHPFLDPGLLTRVAELLDSLEQLSRLPSAEDQALFLGQALTRILADQDGASGSAVMRPSDVLSGLVLESLRQLLSTALRDIHQRAELEIELRSKVLNARREAVLVVEIRNLGPGHAHDVEVILVPQDTSFRAFERRQKIATLLRQQTARLEFLIEPRVSDRVRLTFHVRYSDLERHDQRLDFADVVEFRQAGTLTFRPLHPNPYVVGRPLTEQDLFIGREATFEGILQSLRGVHQDNVVVLIGQRRMGKTSILRRLPEHLGDPYFPVLIDLQGLLGSGASAFFREIAATIYDELTAAGLRLDEPQASEFADDPALTFRRSFLRRVLAALGDRRLLLVFDELEVLEERIRAGDLEPRILPYFRSLMQHEHGVSFIFAGTHRLDELTGHYWSALFNLAIYFDVGHFTQDQVEELFLRPTEGVFEIDPLALEKAFLLTGGHPHFSQLLARELVEYRNRRKLSYITVQDVNVMAGRVVEKGQLHIAYFWDEASRGERLLLLTLKELLEREGLASAASAHRYLSERRIDPGDLQAARHRLERKEILADRAGRWVFRMELLRLWLDRYRDLESFVLSEDRDAAAARLSEDLPGGPAG